MVDLIVVSVSRVSVSVGNHCPKRIVSRAREISQLLSAFGNDYYKNGPEMTITHIVGSGVYSPVPGTSPLSLRMRSHRSRKMVWQDRISDCIPARILITHLG